MFMYLPPNAISSSSVQRPQVLLIVASTIPSTLGVLKQPKIEWSATHSPGVEPWP